LRGSLWTSLACVCLPLCFSLRCVYGHALWLSASRPPAASPLSAVESGAAVRSAFGHPHLPVCVRIKGIFACDWSICTGWPAGDGRYVRMESWCSTHVAFGLPPPAACWGGVRVTLCACSLVCCRRSQRIAYPPVSCFCPLRAACCMLGCVLHVACWDGQTWDLTVRPPRVLPETATPHMMYQTDSSESMNVPWSLSAAMSSYSLSLFGSGACHFNH